MNNTHTIYNHLRRAGGVVQLLVLAGRASITPTQARHCIRELVRRGVAERVTIGYYQWTGVELVNKTPRRGEKERSGWQKLLGMKS